MAAAGDLDGDGRGDVIVGAPGTDNNARQLSGSAYRVTASGLVPAPASAALGTQAVGSSGPAASVRLRNPGLLPIEMAATTIAGANAGDFFLGSDTCAGETLMAGDACTVGVHFSPTATGARTATLAVAGNWLGADVALSGTGVLPPAGPSGAAGATGTPGTSGADGGDGADGAPGGAGPAGTQGAPGTNGTTGAASPAGPAGPAGPPGPAGRNASVTCKVTKPKKVRCTVKLAASRSATATSARLQRGGRVYAHARAPRGRPLRLTAPPGRYTLVVVSSDRSGVKVTRQVVRIA